MSDAAPETDTKRGVRPEYLKVRRQRKRSMRKLTLLLDQVDHQRERLDRIEHQIALQKRAHDYTDSPISYSEIISATKRDVLTSIATIDETNLSDSWCVAIPGSATRCGNLRCKQGPGKDKIYVSIFGNTAFLQAVRCIDCLQDGSLDRPWLRRARRIYLRRKLSKPYAAGLSITLPPSLEES